MSLADIVAELKTLLYLTLTPKGPLPRPQHFGTSPTLDVLDSIGQPDTITLARLIARAPEDFGDWLRDRKNSRKVPHRLEEAGYTAVRNPDARDGLWRVSGRRQAIYAKATLSPQERFRAAAAKGGRGEFG